MPTDGPQTRMNSCFQVTLSGTDCATLAADLRWFGFSGGFHSRCLATHTHFVVRQRFANPSRNSSANPSATCSGVHCMSSQM
jgi:hypothetical protein